MALTQITTRFYYRDLFDHRRNEFVCPTCSHRSAPLVNHLNTVCVCGTHNRLLDGIVISTAPATKKPLTDGERVINRTKALMASGKTRSWSHAMMIAGDTLK